MDTRFGLVVCDIDKSKSSCVWALSAQGWGTNTDCLRSFAPLFQ